MAKLIRSLNYKRNVNLFTEGNPERSWPHVLNTVGIGKAIIAAPTLSLPFSSIPVIPASLTFTRTTTATVIDFAGLVKTTKINEARFQNASRVNNNLPNSTDLSTWTKSAGVTWVIGASDPFGGNSAYTFSTGGATAYIFLATTNIVGNSYLQSVWIKRISGTGPILLRDTNNSTANDISAQLTTSWKRFISPIVPYTSGGVFAIIVSNAGDSIAVYSPMQENVTGHANQNPSEYVSSGTLSYPYHGAGVDGVKYFATTNGNTVTNNVVTEAVGTPLTGITLLAEEVGTNLFLNSATPATQTIPVTPQAYTISMWGTGTCTLSVAAGGVLTGTGANNRVSLTVTPVTSGNLTLTFTGTNTNGQLEAGGSASSYIPTGATSITRTIDNATFNGAGLSGWYNGVKGTYAISAKGTAFRTPSPYGTFNQTFAQEATYCVKYDNDANAGMSYLYTFANGSTPAQYSGISNPVITVAVLQGGLANISKFDYYNYALPDYQILGLLK
jgi:hypothetical protein